MSIAAEEICYFVGKAREKKLARLGLKIDLNSKRLIKLILKSRF